MSLTHLHSPITHHPSPQIILAGSFAFDIIDRFPGGTLNAGEVNWQLDMFVHSTFWKPGVWFLLNLIFLFIVCSSLIKLMGYLAGQALGMIVLQVKMNRKVSLKQLNLYLQDKQIDVQDTMLYAESKTMKICWQEDDEKLWNKSPPQIEMIYDMKFGYILTVFFTVREREIEK